MLNRPFVVRSKGHLWEVPHCLGQPKLRPAPALASPPARPRGFCKQPTLSRASLHPHLLFTCAILTTPNHLPQMPCSHSSSQAAYPFSVPSIWHTLPCLYPQRLRHHLKQNSFPSSSGWFKAPREPGQVHHHRQATNRPHWAAGSLGSRAGPRYKSPRLSPRALGI